MREIAIFGLLTLWFLLSGTVRAEDLKVHDSDSRVFTSAHAGTGKVVLVLENPDTAHPDAPFIFTASPGTSVWENILILAGQSQMAIVGTPTTRRRLMNVKEEDGVAGIPGRTPRVLLLVYFISAQRRHLAEMKDIEIDEKQVLLTREGRDVPITFLYVRQRNDASK